ncbi:MAG: lactonase family protein, partial [Chloroflexi bacterium]|nr:lactonase family protein [Chloroflexota bacterium]
MSSAPDTCFFYVGTYTRNNNSAGIYVYRLDMLSGELTLLSDTRGVVSNPSYLAIHPQRNYLYAVSEITDYQGQPAGGVSAFAIDPKTGVLSLINQQSSGGPGPCYVSVDKTGRYALVANYSGGSVAMLPIEQDGSLLPASDFHQHEGAAMVDPRRQEKAHAHCIYPDPTNEYAFVPDLGLDRVVAYRMDLTAGKLVRHEAGDGQVPAGAGPRHFVIHPNGKFAYVINELASSITAYRYHSRQGTLEPIETISALPADWVGRSFCADVHISPSGQFLYGSNRGHDSIVVCLIDQATGKLKPIQHEWTRGEFPRNFALDPTGTFL